MTPISLTFRAGVDPDAFRRMAATRLAPTLGRGGWNLRHQGNDVFIWQRRYWPRKGQVAFVAVMLLGFFVLIPSLSSADNNLTLLVLVIWIGLMIGCGLIRQTGELYMGFHGDEAGTAVEVTGTADRKTTDALRELADV